MSTFELFIFIGFVIVLFYFYDELVKSKDKIEELEKKLALLEKFIYNEEK